MKTAALVIGALLLALGVAGLVPGLSPDGLLFGVMPMNTVMSVLFAITGVAGIAIGISGRRGLAPTPNTSGNDMRPWI